MKKYMWVSKITKEDLAHDVIDYLLFEGLHDNEASVDCIILLGSILIIEEDRDMKPLIEINVL